MLNGSQGLNDIATGVAAQGLAVYKALREALTAGDGDGRGARRAVEPLARESAGAAVPG